MLVGTQRSGRAVEHRVDELVSVGGAETLGETHALVDHDAIGDLGPRLQLVRPDEKHRVLDGIELIGTFTVVNLIALVAVLFDRQGTRAVDPAVAA